MVDQQTWTQDWPERLRLRLNEIGFATIEAFLKQFPAEPYVEVVKRIAPWVAAMQLTRLQMEEAKRIGILREAAMDSLCRNINWLPQGWVTDSTTESRAAGAAANTTTSIVIDGHSPEFRSPMLDVYKALKELNPPVGWKPSDPNDPFIQQAFERGWPENAVSPRQ